MFKVVSQLPYAHVGVDIGPRLPSLRSGVTHAHVVAARLLDERE